MDSQQVFREAFLKKFPMIGEELTISYSEESGLYLVNSHFQSDDHEFNKNTRGAVWKYESELELVWPSLGYPRDVLSNSIKLEEGKLTLDKGNTIEFDQEPEFSLYIEGFVLRMGIYKGKKLMFTHSNINANKFRWGSVKLSDVAQHLGCPDFDDVFGSVSDEEITECVHLMLTNKDTITGPRQDFLGSLGYITYLGTTTSPMVNRKSLLVPRDLPLEEFPGTLIISNLGVINQIKLSLEQANHMLKFGHRQEFEYNNPVLLPGEAVMIKIGDNLVKVTPDSLYRRNRLRCSDPSVRNRFYQLISEPWDSQAFANLYYNIRLGNCHNIRDLIRVAPLVRANSMPFDERYLKQLSTDHSERIRLIYINYIYALPPTQQREFTSLYEDYINSISKLLSFFKEYYLGHLVFIDPETLTLIGTINNQLDLIPGRLYHKTSTNLVYDITDLINKGLCNTFYVLIKKPHFRLDLILQQAIKYTNNKLKGKRVSDGHYLNLLITNISFLLSKEKHTSKYQMIKQCDAWVLPNTIMRA